MTHPATMTLPPAPPTTAPQAPAAMSRVSASIGSRVLAAAVPLLLLFLAACGGGAPAAPPRTVTVLAAASLTEVFTTLGRDFETGRPGTTVVLSFAGSSSLAAQINAGAPADVFAAASMATMKPVVDAGSTAAEPVVFARNQLVIAVPRGNPRGVTGLTDLARPGVKVALCAPPVPCGAAARTALAAAGVALTPVTLEQDVKATLAKLRLGEVDAALVYRTDAAAASDQVAAVEFPESAAAVNEYPIVALAGAPNPGGAAAFVAYVRSPAGVAALSAAGFQPP